MMQAPIELGGSNSLVQAVQWLQGTLLGTVATTISIVAVATIGLLMLTGRIPYRRAASVVIGCFLIFGATTIVAGIRSTIADQGAGFVPIADYAPSPLSPPPPRATMPAYDPYAGASVPAG